MSKFAPITANLLARKGEALPSAMPQSKPPFAWEVRNHVPPPAQPAPQPQEHEHLDAKHPHDPDRPRRLFVPLTHDEHERLAIAAVKKNVSQHQIVHNALHAYFEKLAADAQCQCIAGVCTLGCGAH